MIIIDGVPGSGKTSFMTELAIKEFKKANTKRLRMERIKRGEHYINPFIDNNGFYHFIFTNYPILLNKKYNIYSQKGSIFYLDFKKRFPKGAMFFFMEGQLSYDSMEYMTFPDVIATYMQLHRHQDVSQIFIDTQNISRLPKYEKNVAMEWWRIINTFKIPFLPIGIRFWNSTYSISTDDGNSLMLNETKWQHHFSVVWNIKNVYDSYNDKCMSALSENAELIEFNMFDNLKMTKKDIKELHFRTKEEKKLLAQRDVFEEKKDKESDFMPRKSFL